MALEPLKKAVQIAGGQSALARALTTSDRKLIQANVQKWLNSPNPDKMPPAEYCPSIERATGVTCEELRPDVDWAFVRNCACNEENKAA
jgi:DNA-binding transcriptional regulator YdaS (Cro superfamily)